MANNQKPKSDINLETRPPVVVIMGHVDHGKTTLLDCIRKTKVAEGEAGGITQHIGAYQAEHQGKKVTFIDTPGHEAFYAMRSRGAKVADIAVLVIAADDGVMTQTKEALDHIKHAGIPIVVAISKIDKPNADPMKIKNQLLEAQIVVEDFKGKVPSVEFSSKTGQGIDSLLEIINLVAEVEELKADMEAKAGGVVIEAELNHKRGPTATLLVKEGILKVNDVISLSSTFGRARELEDFMGNSIESIGPGSPALVVGLEEVALVGDKFKVVGDIDEARKIKEEKQKKYGEPREIIEPQAGVKVLNVVLKADVGGTLEAVREVLRGIKNDNLSLRILSQSVGEITESDIKFASAANAVIVGFRTKVSQSAELFARQMKIEIVLSDIIYELVHNVRVKIGEFLSGEEEEIKLGVLKVLAIFRTEKSRMIVGGKVTEGEVKRGARVRATRGEEMLGEGKIAQLKVKDKAVGSVEKGQECGVLFDGSVKIRVGDILEAYEIQSRSIKL
ncbi:MAG: translation initiation factor IF-2 [Candidatus Spechtbacterales bacterium]